MEPIALAAATAAITVLGTKVAEGVAGEAAKSLWQSLLKLFGWNTAPSDLARATAEHLQAHPEHAAEAIRVLQQDTGPVGMLVGRIDADKVIVAQNIHNINM